MIDVEKNWARLHQTTVNVIHDSALAARYQLMFNALGPDKVIDPQTTLLGLKRAPGSKERHHDVVGGLVAHLLQMWTIWEWMATMLRSMDCTPFASELVWRGIVHHDLNKVYRYRVTQETPLRVEYADDLQTELLGSVHKISYILNLHYIPLDLVLLNALITAEGGYAKYHPRTQTPLAKVLYLCDDLSANVVDRMQSGRFWDSKRDGWDETLKKTGGI